MTVLSAPRTSTAAVDVVGELDLSSLPRVRAEIDEALAGRPERLIVDLSACPFVDASALSMLLDAHRRARRSGGSLPLRGCSPRVLRLLALTGLRGVFDLVGDADPDGDHCEVGVSGAAR